MFVSQAHTENYELLSTDIIIHVCTIFLRIISVLLYPGHLLTVARSQWCPAILKNTYRTRGFGRLILLSVKTQFLTRCFWLTNIKLLDIIFVRMHDAG
jgi:hypothetical protein